MIEEGAWMTCEEMLILGGRGVAPDLRFSGSARKLQDVGEKARGFRIVGFFGHSLKPRTCFLRVTKRRLDPGEMARCLSVDRQDRDRLAQQVAGAFEVPGAHPHHSLLV